MVNQCNCVQFHFLIVILTARFSIDVSGMPVASIESRDVQRQRLDIYKRQNSQFNRLLSNKIDYSSYESFNDAAPSQEENDIKTSESRRFGGGIRRRPCVPVYPNSYRRGKKQRRRNGAQYNGYNEAYNGAQNDGFGRTLYDLNFYFLGYQPNQYQVNPGTQTVSAIAAVDQNKPVSQSQNQYDHYGGYYDCEPNPFYRPPFWAGSNSYGDGALYNDPNRPSYLGLLGQGLFDFINGLLGYGNPNAGGGSGGYDTPVSSGASSVLNEQNDEKPVYEINVPDTIAALVNLSINNSFFCNFSNSHNFFCFCFYRIQITGDLAN